MRTLFVIPLVLMSLVSFPSWSLNQNDLVYRAGLYYEKFTATPFTGEVEGIWRGSIKNGRMDGYWEIYYENGQLMYKGNLKNDKEEGYWENYWYNGQLASKGDYKNGKKEGYWEYYWEDGLMILKRDLALHQQALRFIQER